MGSGRAAQAAAAPDQVLPFMNRVEKKLEIVLKCDTFGTVEAVNGLIARIKAPEVDIRVIHSGVGAVYKSDLLMAMTGSRLVIGFEVDVMPKLEQWIKEHEIEVRLYRVVYKLAEDIKNIASSLVLPEAEEVITGKARVIALFKSRHRAIILGCEVWEGNLSVGKDFRVISAMGPIYSGRIESLQVESSPVKEARIGQQVGIKIHNFDKARLGDLIECYETAHSKKGTIWRPSGTVVHIEP